MTETTAQTAHATSSGKGLVARLVGVVFSPRATFEDVAAHPRVLGALLVTLVLTVGVSSIFLTSEVGKQATLERQDRAMQSMGFRLSDAQYEQLRERMMGPTMPIFAGISILVSIALFTVVIAGVLIAVFNAILGGNATFKQVYAVVVHSQFLAAAGTLFIYPLDYMKQSLSSPTSLAVFFPFLDEGTFFARFFGVIDLFYIWVIVNLAIGMGVLYRRRTAPIATSLLVGYAAIALCIAAVGVAFSGA